VPTAGDDTFICDSGTAAGLTDTQGNNSLQLPAGGTGTIEGAVTFGPGADRIDIQSGTITGNVQQGSGIDDFRMTGGVIQSLNQGDNLDTFFMSEGRIIDAFDDGDRAIMTGGRIGRVNMKLDDNLFDMSGGAIDRNLVTGFGNDTIILSAGTIGGNISVSGGTDKVTITGGSVGGDVLMSFGTDEFTWNGGGIIYGTVDLGGDSDKATLKDLSNANFGETNAITGGLGVDALTLDNVTFGGVARLQAWETVDATNDTELLFDGTLTLGDAETGTGTLNVDSSSTIFGGGANGAVTAAVAGQMASLVNAGRIDLTNGGGSAGDTFTVAGNYTGAGGMLLLDTVLGDDSSVSDRLVISGGAASGSTGLSIVNAGGAGASTAADGIMVVEAANGATTASGAFALNGAVAAGAYEYFLFKGGVTAGTGENWYLRSTLTPTTAEAPTEVAPGPSPLEEMPSAEVTDPVEPETPPAPPEPVPPAPPAPPEATPDNPDPVDPAPPVEATDPAPVTPAPPVETAQAEPPAPPPAPPTATPSLPVAGLPASEQPAPPTPDATPVIADSVPLYRVEVPTYAVLPPVAHDLALTTLGTFHERRGEQSLLQGGGTLPGTWGRVFGLGTETKWGGTVAPTFDGEIFGLQAGQDIAGWESATGHHDRVGLFVGYANADGDIRGQALGWNDLAVGSMDLDGTSVGAYWTHVGPTGWYADAVLMGTWFNGDATSERGVGIDIEGHGVTVSLEGGYPFQLSPSWTLEPQAQIIWNEVSLDDQTDAFSRVGFDSQDGFTGRVGMRLQGNFQTGGATLLPYFKANIWHRFSDDYELDFGGDPIVTEVGGTSLEVGGGLVAKLTEATSLFATADYTTDIGGGDSREAWEGNIGVSIRW
jgi:outer membrane autotransporter protein